MFRCFLNSLSSCTMILGCQVYCLSTSVGKLALLFFIFCSVLANARRHVSAIFSFVIAMKKARVLSSASQQSVHDGSCYYPAKSCMKLTVSCAEMLHTGYNFRHDTAFRHDTVDAHVLMDIGTHTGTFH